MMVHLAVTQPQELARQRQLAGDVAAANFYAYRGAVISYLNANPGTTGTVADGGLTWPLGYIRNPAWTNLVDSGTLYTYSTTVPSNEAMEAIAKRGGRSMMIGYKTAGNTMTSINGAAAGFTLPAAMVPVPAGAVVVIGK
jgi:hypothetical protein